MRKINLIYSTQTGNSYMAAKYVQNTVRKITGIEIILHNIETVHINSIFYQSIVIYILSTHGDGDFPYSMQNYWNLLKLKNLPPLFTNRNFLIFGCGDSNYAKFNYAAKKLFARIKNLGGSELIPIGLGDEQDPQGLYTELKSWTDLLIEKIEYADFKFFPLKSNEEEWEEAIIKEKTFLRENILEVQLNLTNTSYRVGDVIGICPLNYNYAEFIAHNNIGEDISAHDFNCVPDYYLIIMLYDYAKNNPCIIFDEKRRELILKKLEELSRNFDQYYEYVIRVRRTFFEVLKDLYIRIPIEFIRNSLRKIQTRYFTLQKNNNGFFIVISLIKYKNELQGHRIGLVSEYLRLLSVNEKILIKRKNTLLRFSDKKLLILCTGTGISVARACWSNIDRPIVLFYGFRKRMTDRIYHEEYLSNKNIRAFECPSRETPHKYIQEMFFEKFSDEISQYDILVAGGSYLNKEIKNILHKKYGKKINFQAETW